jgi:7-cyano-7-deazaguanine synthase
MNGAVVLLSGGLDSLVSLAEAVKREKGVMALTFDYGQIAAKREIEASRRISKYYGVKHEVIKFDWLKKNSSTALIIPLRCARSNKGKKDKIPGLNVPPGKGAEIVWVPNRNGVMINIAAAMAEALGYKKIVIGTNAEEGSFFSDNTADFIKAVNRALGYSARGNVKVISFTGRFKKREIIRRGFALNAPLRYLWSCYRGGRELCLKCHSCGYLVRSLKAEGVWDSFWKQRKKSGYGTKI